MHGILKQVTKVEELEIYAEHIAPLAKNLISYYPEFKDEENFLNLLINIVPDPKVGIFVHVGQGKLNGIAVIETGTSYMGSALCEIIMAACNEPEVSKEFMANLEQWARDQGMERIQAGSGRARGPFIRYMEKYGYNEAYTLVVKELHDNETQNDLQATHKTAA